MEAVTLILTALAAGAAGAAKEVGGEALKDAYTALKAALLRRFGDTPAAKVALEEHAKDPETWEKPLETQLVKSGASEDPNLVRMAQEVMQHADPEGVGKGRYDVQFHGTAQGVIVGDEAHQENVFGAPLRER